jgi:Secretory lipase
MAVPQPKNDPFYQYTDSLAAIPPGTVLKTRSFAYRAFGVPTWLKATQLLYRSTSQTGSPTVNVTSVIQPPEQGNKTKVISYQSAYDSLNQNDEPSHAISGGVTLGGLVPNVEVAVFGPFLAEGYTVIVPDTEGQRADFAAGPEYGMNTLDSMRAVFSASSTVGLPNDARVAMLGYSGGAIATEWAAELAPAYAPDVNARLIGAAMGGLLVDPAHNLHYVEGTWFWGGVLPMALVGIARAFEIDFTPYLTPTGLTVFNEMQTVSIVDVLGRYKGLTWQKLIIPAYPTPERLPVYVAAANKLIMGTGAPTIPLFIGQGAYGLLEGTPGDKAGIGPGDGVMIAGDVRTLARNYCAKGTKVHYEQYDALGHISSLVQWLPHSIAWIQQRFADLPAPQNCSSIAPGNSLAPIPVP